MTPQLRQAVLAVTALLALGVVCAVSWTPRPAILARSEEPVARMPRATPPPAPAETGAGAATPSRNVFEFVDRAPAARIAPLPRVVVPAPLAPEMAPSLPAPSPVRLVGLVRRGRVLHAALSVSGQLAVLGVGEESDGYVVLAIDEDVGVTVRTPDGSQQVLSAESR